MKRILLRIDDVCPTMDFHQFQIAMELMDKYNVKPLLGVIPDCKDPDLQIEPQRKDFWDFVKGLQQKGYTLAMHGCNHVFDNHARGLVVKRWDSEFAGHSYETQLEKIRKGKEILESHGIQTDVFFAPGHSYDENTLKALSACGFKFMSDGLSFKPYQFNGVICVPVRSAGMPNLYLRETHTAVFHVHEWVREEKSYCYCQFVDLLEHHNQEILPWNEFVRVNVGNFYVQRTIERMSVLINRYVRPTLSNMLYTLKNSKSKPHK
jgi:predicted deacetylase